MTFRPGDAHRLAFADRSFDAVVCLRVLMHTPGWRQSLGELCRVARDRVVFDYPALGERGGAAGRGRDVSRMPSGADVEAYRVFSDRAIARELDRPRLPHPRMSQAVRAADRAAQTDRIASR